MHLEYAGKVIDARILDMIIDAEEPSIFYMLEAEQNIKVMTNIGNLTHPDNKTRLKIFNPHKNDLYVGNTFNMTMYKLDADPSCCTGFMDSDKIPLNRRFVLRGDIEELIDIALTHFTLVPIEEYQMG